MRILSLVALALTPAVAGAQTTPSTAVIDSAMLARTAERTITDALRGKAAGVRVVTTSGSPGSAPSIVIRNAGMNGATAPLVIIDGVPTRRDLADFNVQDIERIEVLKGAATASEYGVGASNGVIVITTRRGARGESGRTDYVVRSDFGSNNPPAMQPAAAHHPWVMNADGSAFVLGAGGNRILEMDGIADNPFPAYIDPPSRLIASRLTMANFASATRRWAGTSAYLSLSADRDAGIVSQLDAYRRQHARLAVDQSLLAGRLRLAGTSTFARTRDDIPQGAGTWWFATLPYIEPWFPLDSLVSPCTATATHCYVPTIPVGTVGVMSNPLLELEGTPTAARVGRLHSQLSAAYAIAEWLDAEARLASDRRGSATTSVVEPNANGNSMFTHALGDTTRASHTTLALVGRRDFRDGRIRSRTRLQYTDDQQRRTLGERSVNGTGPTPPSSESWTYWRESLKTFALATTVDVGDRASFHGAISRPDAASFVSDDEGTVYHRVGASYRPRDEVRLHAAYGTSAPPPLDVGQIDFFTQRPVTRPFATEREAGVALQHRELQASYVLSRQRTNGYLGIAFVPTSMGFVSTWANLGDVEGTAHELSLRTRVVQRGNVAWDAGINLHRTRSRIDELHFPESQQANGTFTRAGEPLGRFHGRRWIRTAEQLAETIASGQLTGTAADYVLNQEGFYVRASQLGTAGEVPLIYFSCVTPNASGCSSYSDVLPLGDYTPDLELGFVNAVRVKSLSLSATMTGVIGGEVVNHQRQVAMLRGRAPEVDQSGRPAGDRKPVSYYRAMATVLAPNELFVESATHVKLRELSLEWTLPSRWTTSLRVDAARLGVSGRNLWTSGAYRGYDPDVVTATTRATDYRIDRGGHPPYRSVVATLRVGL